MKKTILTLLSSIFCIAAGATQQINDRLTWNGEVWEIPVSPLTLLQPETSDAFRALIGERDFISTANYRGYIAYWYINRNRLYLDRIEVPQKDGTNKILDRKALKKTFRKYSCCGKIKAGWITGNIKVGKGVGSRDQQNPFLPVFEEEKTIILKKGSIKTAPESSR